MSPTHSTVQELEQQLTRTYALVASARSALLEGGADPQSIAVTLLDMAEDELADLRLIRRSSRHADLASTGTQGSGNLTIQAATTF